MNSDVKPFTKEWVDYAASTVTVGVKRYVYDLTGNLWEIGYFDVATQTYWCTRFKNIMVAL